MDLFTDQSDVLWKDWLPTFELAAAWNNWTEEEKLWQLAGHLRGKVSQEWTLLPATDKLVFAFATRALSKRLDRGTKALAAQEFCYTTQRSSESVSNFILRLEQTFRRGYGHESMSVETRDTLLYGQLQEGLKCILMKSPVVSGARNYNELYQAAHSEERRLTELQRRQQYQSDLPKFSNTLRRNDNNKSNPDKGKNSSGQTSAQTTMRNSAADSEEEGTGIVGKLAI